MAKQALNDIPVRPLERLISSMCQTTGYTPDSVFEGMLDYIIGYMNPTTTPTPVEGWKFKPEDTPTFHKMFQMITDIYVSEIPRKGWYDPFGELYMALHPSGGGKGQFFTPVSLAQLAAEVTVGNWTEKDGVMTPFGRRMVINDPAAGSGRMPLAGYVAVLKEMQFSWGYDAATAEAKRPYISCEDLDFNCVKMCAINLAFHGCFGEAVCHDSLADPGEVRLGYIVNETMWPFPTVIPSIRKETDPMRFVCTRHWGNKKAATMPEPPAVTTAKPTPTPTPKADEKPKERKAPQQLTLW